MDTTTAQRLFAATLPTLMKTFCMVCLVLLAEGVAAQLVFPNGFYLKAGDNLAGEEDVYTNGKLSFATHKIFREYHYKGNDEGVRKFMSTIFHFPFYLTRDSLCWGTGKVGLHQEFYAYLVVTPQAEVLELYSLTNDADFAFYSRWLLRTVREYQKKGKLAVFPMRVK